MTKLLSETEWRKLIGVVLVTLGTDLGLLFASHVDFTVACVLVGKNLLFAVGSFFVNPQKVSEAVVERVADAKVESAEGIK